MVRTGVTIYIITMSIIGFCQMGIDKSKASHQKYRISERTLLLTAGLGGSFGSLLGMYIFHHKTRHRAFSWGLPLLVLIHIALLYLVYFVL